MRIFFAIPFIFFISLLSSPSWSETVSRDDLVERNDLFYKKFTDVPFTGEVKGLWVGELKEGKKDGLWLLYQQNGQLGTKAVYKNGLRNGLFEDYFSNGCLGTKGNYKDGRFDGVWSYYSNECVLRMTETWKDGVFLQ